MQDEACSWSQNMTPVPLAVSSPTTNPYCSRSSASNSPSEKHRVEYFSSRVAARTTNLDLPANHDATAQQHLSSAWALWRGGRETEAVVILQQSTDLRGDQWRSIPVKDRDARLILQWFRSRRAEISPIIRLDVELPCDTSK